MSIIKETLPHYFVLEKEGYISIELTHKIGVETRPLRSTLTLQVLQLPSITPTSLPDADSFDPNQISLITNRCIADKVFGTAITGLEGDLIVIPLNLFMESLDMYVLKNIREVQSDSVIYRKLKIKLFKSKKIEGTNIVAKFEDLRSYKSYSFTFISGYRGQQPSETVRVGGLSYSLYPETVQGSSLLGRPTSSVVSESVIDRPVRFIVRGCCIATEDIYTHPSLKQLENIFTSGIAIGKGNTIYLLPVIEILGDTVAIRSAQLVGYTRVAAQAGKTPGILAKENGGRI